MALNRAAIHYDNLIRSATLTATSAASSSMGVDKLRTSSPRERWRSTGRVAETIIAAASVAETWPLVLIEGHNLTAAATVRIRISANADLSAPSYDCTFWAWPSIMGLDEGGLDEGGLDGAPVVEDLEDWQKRSAFLLDLVLSGTAVAGTASTITLPSTLSRPNNSTEPVSARNDDYLAATVRITGGTGTGQSAGVAGYDAATRVLTLDAALSPAPDSTSGIEIDLSFPITRAANDGTYTGKYLGVTLSDPENPDLVLEAGVLMAGRYEQPTYDIDPIPDAGFVDPSEWVESYGRDVFVDELPMHRTQAASYSFLSEAEANALAMDMGGRVGRRLPVFFIPCFENTARLYSDAIYGLFEAAPTKRQVRPGYSNHNWQVQFSIRGL